jgi:hypothetical protein
MKKFVVKHLAYEHGPIVKLYKKIKKQPQSYTNDLGKARTAAEGSMIYVIEAVKHVGRVEYYAAYRFKSFDFYEPASGRWLDQFKYKNVSHYSSPIGDYFEKPVAIKSQELDDWLRNWTFGMRRVPEQLSELLGKLFDNSSLKRPF